MGIDPIRPKAALLTIDQAAERLGVTPRMIRRLTASRRLPFVKVGRLVRFNDSDVAQFVVDSTVQALHSGRRGA